MKYIIIGSILILYIGFSFQKPNIPPQKIEKKEFKTSSIKKEQIKKTKKNIPPISSLPPLILSQKKIKKNTIIFQEVDMYKLKEKIEPKKDINPILAVKIKKNSIKNLKIGDKITLPYMESEYSAKIIKKEINKDKTISITGEVLDTNEGYFITLTEGDKYVFGNFYLPFESFEMELNNGIGYIYAIDDIDNKRINYSKNDFIIPSFLSL